MVIIISSREDDSGYREYRDYLKNGIKKGFIYIQESVKYTPKGFVFNSKRIYDFTRSAKATVRDKMVDYLDDDDVLPGLQKEDRKNQLQEAFDCLFNYSSYKEYLSEVRQQRDESVKMFVFDDQDKEYIAHIKFSSTTTRDAFDQFTVYAKLKRKRYIRFPLQKTDYDTDYKAVLTALPNLRVK